MSRSCTSSSTVTFGEIDAGDHARFGGHAPEGLCQRNLLAGRETRRTDDPVARRREAQHDD